MKTILSRLKDLINTQNNAGNTLDYVRSFEVVHPDLDLTVTSLATLPRIVFVPVSTSEDWVASQEKQAVNVVNAYLMLRYNQRESSIMGDSTRPGGQGKGIVDFVADFMSVVRGHRLAVGGTNYLNKPLDVTGVEYVIETVGENAHILVAQITMLCQRVFLQTSLPGDV